MIECSLYYIYEAKFEISNELKNIRNLFLNFQNFRRRNHSHAAATDKIFQLCGKHHKLEIKSRRNLTEI